MNATDLPTIVPPSTRQGYQRVIATLNGLVRGAVRRRLEKIERGQLTLVENGETTVFGEPDDHSALRATVWIEHPAFYTDLAFGGSVGAGGAYMDGLWRCDNLTDLIRLFLRNYDVLETMEGGSARFSSIVHRLMHRLNRNSVAGSRRNIAAHYDLGNELYQLFLDPTMMYSCGIFESDDMTLHEASVAKLDRICRKLDLQPSDHVVEIGTGWGGFAIHAAQHYGCQVTTTTISRKQHELARQRIDEAGLGNKINLLFEDYRDLSGQYDKLVSIEMVEAVGHEFYQTYFAKCSELLKPEGAMLLQAITISDQRYTAARDDVDFIKRYIFPGSCIPSVTALIEAATCASDLRLFHHEDIGPHYATTLRHWRENFFSHLDEATLLGYSDTFARMWEFYLCYCEGGFIERWISDVHMLFTKPENRLSPVLPPLRKTE